MMKITLIGLNLLFFLFLFLLVIHLWRESVRTMHHLVEHSRNSSEKRKEEAEQKRKEEGNQDKMGLLYRMDLSLQQSGILQKMPFLNTELYLFLVAICSLIVFAVTDRITHQLLFGAIAGSITIFFFYFMISAACSRNYNRLENNLIKFTNLLESYSQTEDDLIAILGKVYPALSEPLHGMVRTCYAEASTDGDMEAAFEKMKRKIPHRKLRELLDNLETCSMHQANYPEVIAKNRHVIRVNLAEKEKRKQTVRSERVNIVIILCCGAVCIGMIDNIMGGELFHSMIESGLGQGLLFLLFFVIIYALYNMVTMGNVKE